MRSAPRAMVGNCDSALCVSRAVLANLASKWSPLVLRQLGHGEKRYSQLRHAIEGVSEKMLAQTLRELERDGLILRTKFEVVPPHVVYSLTPLGRECSAHIGPLLAWIEANVQGFKGARRHYDAKSARRAA